jgi:hypothetical protein
MMEFIFNLDKMERGEDGVFYGPGDIVVTSDGKTISRYLIMFPNGHTHGGNKDVMILLATSKEQAPTAWRRREIAGTL